MTLSRNEGPRCGFQVTMVDLRPFQTRAVVLGIITFCAWNGCTCGSTAPEEDGGAPDSGMAPDAGQDAGPSTDSGSADSGPPADAGPGDAGSLDAGSSDGGACPLAGDPAACDDGTGSLGTNTACPVATVPGATESHHLTVSGSMFATVGACVYVTPTSCPEAHGDVLEFSGGDGTTPGVPLDGLGQATPYCLRLLSVAWDSNWADDGFTDGGPVGLGGNVLAASQRPQALIEWVHTYLRSSSATPLCASGGSAGSSLLLFQLMHNNGEQLLDHVQVVSATPYARFDKGCDSATPEEGTDVVCSALPPTTEPQYDFLQGSSNPGAVRLVSGETHDPNCDDGGVQTAHEAAALQAMSLVTASYAPITLRQTSLSVYMCATVPNATQGQAVYVFGVNADLASADAGPYTGLISLHLGTPFYGCPSGTACVPHIVCDSACATESYGETAADKMSLAEDMLNNCVARH
jgi:hypothetical protein